MAPRSVKKRKVGGAADQESKTEAAADAEPPAKVSKSAAEPPKPPAEEFKVPDAAEVLEIARTQNLYKSNLFRLQLEEVLKEVAPRAKHPRLEVFLRKLKDVLEGLAPRSIPGDFSAEFPALHFREAQPAPFEFSRPKRIDVVGSLLLGTCLRKETCADVAVEMPADAFKSKDYLNFRYLDKRAAYVGELVRQLQALSQQGDGGGGSSSSRSSAVMAGVTVEVGSLQGDLLRPCVVLRAGSSGAPGDETFTVRLLPSCPAELLPAAKLGPDRNLVRAVCAKDDPSSLPPTPHYNSCLLEDVRMRSHLELLHHAFKRIPALKDAVLLLKQWAAARGFLFRHVAGTVCTPLTGFCLSILAAHAGQTSNVAPGSTSSFQLFKLALTVLSSTEWAAQKLTFGVATATPLTAAEAKSCRAHFCDADGAFNFFWRLGPFMGEIASEAQRCLRILDAQSDPFEAVFGQQASSPALSWDLTVRTTALAATALSPAGAKLAGGPAIERFAAPPDAPEAAAIAERLVKVLKEGLGDRCLKAVPRLVVGDAGIAVVVGFQLEATMLERFLDRGPTAESEAAKQFRALWGPEKSELRRFRDGSVLECSVWAKPPAGRASESRKQPAVITQIVQHLLRRHFPEVAADCDVLSGPSGFVTNLGDQDRRLWQAFEAFRSHLCQLSSLPLTIKDVHAVDPAFSYNCPAPRVAPAAADGVARTLHDVIVEFESSGRWPDDPAAGQKVSAAMLLKMKEELESDLGLEAGVTEGFLDVRFPEFVFRLQIFHEKELIGVAHRVTNFQASLSAAPPGQESLERLRALWWRPRIRGAMHAEVLQKPAMAGATRLCQRWLGSQLLAGYEEFAEHLVAAAFLQPTPFETPTSPHVGLCRVLWLLDTHDWAREPLVLDFDGKLSSEERLSIRHSFERSHADAGVHASFWIASRYDPHALLVHCPPATVSRWLRSRARHALGVVHRRLLGAGAVPGWDALFALDTSVFDVIVRLRAPEEDARKKGDRAKAAAAPQAVASLVAKLRAHLSPVALVFHDMDDRVLALKWRPTAFFPQHQNVLMGAVPHTMIRQDDGGIPVCVPNILYLTSTIASLAEGLLVDISLVGVRPATGGR